MSDTAGDPKLQAGFAELGRRFSKVGLEIIEHSRPWRDRKVTFFVVGKADRRTDIVLSDQFVSDLPNSQQFQAGIDSYALAVANRIRCGSPEAFYCVTENAVRVEIQWPIQSGMSGSNFATVFLVDVINLPDGKIAKCAVDLERGWGVTASAFDEVCRAVNRIRSEVDKDKLTFYDVGVHVDQFQRIRADSDGTNSARSESDIERFLAGKTYFLGFKAVDVPGEIWIADPWDAAYLGVSAKELKQSAYVLRARGLIQLDSTMSFARPSDKLITEGLPNAIGTSTGTQKPKKLSLSSLPQKQQLITDVGNLLMCDAEFALLVIDLDHFKNVNDTKGHPAGDACLERVVEVIGDSLGRKGVLYRWGGDEFAIVLPDFSTDEALVTAERLRVAVERARPGGDILVTASIGVVGRDRSISITADELFASADRGMYESKRHGKNRTTLWTTHNPSQE